MSDTESQAAALFAHLGIGPDQLGTLLQLGASGDQRIHVLLPERVQPEIAAALLALLGHSMIDVAKAARQSSVDAQAIINRLKVN